MAVMSAIEGLPFDINLLIKRLKQDMKDDWFPDALNFKDSLKTGTVEEYFKKYKKSPSIQYKPSRAEQFNLPKKGFTLRYALETNIYDRIAYQVIAGYLIQFYDKLLNSCVFSHRWNRSTSSKYIFNQPIDAYKNFELAIKNEYENGIKTLVVSDIQNFYENIRISDIKSSLVVQIPQLEITAAEEAQIRMAINIVTKLLRKWSVYKKHGIPQNRDASSFLSNIVLHSIDNEMLQKGYNYFRYMDDIRIVCSNIFHARRALKDLVIALRKKGLNVNSQKSFILTKKDKEINDYIKRPNRLIEQIDQLWKSKKLTNIQITLPQIKTYTLELIRKKKTQAREFRFCVGRLEKIALCKEIKRDFDFSKITNAIIKELIHQPFSSDKLIRYLKCVDLTNKHLRKLSNLILDESKNIYSWQCYHLWQLFVFHKYINSNLITHAKNIISSKAKYPPPAIGGAMLYLGSCGTIDDKIYVAKKFKNFKSYLIQRNGMIATHELEYKKHVKPYIKDYVINELVGTYGWLRGSCLGKYYTPLDPIPVSELFRDLTQYD